jgi:hypothetical protein
MDEWEEMLSRPVLRGLITYDKLLVPGVRLTDVARMCEWLAVETENQYRSHEYANRKK